MFSYDNNPQQISNIADTSYRTEGAIVKTAKRQSYGYDANGNLIYVNLSGSAGSRSFAEAYKDFVSKMNTLIPIIKDAFSSDDANAKCGAPLAPDIKP